MGSSSVRPAPARPDTAWAGSTTFSSWLTEGAGLDDADPRPRPHRQLRQVSALIDRQGDYVWACAPQVDGDPIFCSLLSDEDRRSRPRPLVCLARGLRRGRAGLSSQHRHTTHGLQQRDGGRGRADRLRAAVPPVGTHLPPRRLRPHPAPAQRRAAGPYPPAAGLATGERRPPESAFGSNHIRFAGSASIFRLTTNWPISHIERRAPVPAGGRTRPVPRTGRAVQRRRAQPASLNMLRETADLLA